MKKALLSFITFLLLPACVWGFDVEGDLGVKGKVTIQDSATKPPLNVTERSTAPSNPSSGDIYLDDGSNTASGSPGWRRYTGVSWEDVSSGGGSGTYPSAGIALSTGSAWSTSITNNSANWNTAYSDRLKWDGGSSGLTASTGRTSLGLGSAATRAAEDTLTNGSNLPDGAAIIAYGNTNWGSGTPDLNELTTSTTNAHGDYFAVVDSATGTAYKLTKGNIAVSGFDNDLGWSSNSGTVTSITAGAGLTGGVITNSGTVSLTTPGTLSSSTTNASATNHTHAISNYSLSGTTNQITVTGAGTVLGAATTLSLPSTVVVSNLSTSQVKAIDSSGLKLYDDGGTAGVFVKDGGYVGVGFASPLRKLHVGSVATGGGVAVTGSAPSFVMSNADTEPNTVNTQSVFFGLATAAGHYGLNSGDGILSLQGTSRGDLYLDSNYNDTAMPKVPKTDVILQPSLGNVGIGTTTPTTKLHVNGDITATNFIGNWSGASTAWTAVTDYSTLASALASGTPWIMVTADITLAGSPTVLAATKLSFVKGKKITLGGYSLTIAGILDAGPYQIFVQSSTTNKVSFSGRPSPQVYVEWWGGEGNDSTNNLDAFNYAIASLPSGEGGGVIKLLANATYRVSGEVTVNKSGVFIEGSGKRSSAIKTTSTTANILKWYSASGTLYSGGVSNVSFLATSKKSAGACVYFQNAHYMKASDLFMTGYPGSGVSGSYIYDGIVSMATYELTISHCQISCSNIGVSLTGTSDTYRTVECNIMNVHNYADIGFDFTYCEGVYTWDLSGWAGRHGLYIHPSSSAFVKNVWLNNFISDVTTQHGIYIYNSSSDDQAVANINITNSWSVNAGYNSGGTPAAYDGIRVDGNVDKITNIKIIGTKIGFNGGYGIYMGQYPNYTIIANNDIFLNSRNSANIYDHIRLDGNMAFVSVNGNMLSQYGGQARYGINVTAGTGAFFNITGNIITGYQTAPIYFAATGADNQIFGNSPKSTYDRLTIGGDFTVDGACSGCP